MFAALKRKMTPPDAAATVEALEAELAEVEADLARWNTAHAETALASADGELGATKALSELGRKITKAEAKRRDLETALRLARERVQLVTANEQDRQRAEQWEKAQALAFQRDRLAEELETTITDLHTKYERLLAVSAELYETAPEVDDKLAWSALSIRNIEEALRKHLVRTGFSWAFSWPWEREKLPALAEQVAKGNQAILSRRGAA